MLSQHHKIKNVVFGISGLSLTKEEKSFFTEVNPLGFILFSRNCKSPIQIKKLITSLKECVNREEVLILIDQEGGRVSRLKPPYFKCTPPAAHFTEIAKKDMEAGYNSTFDNYLSIGNELKSLGINVNCAPVADLYFPDSNIVIGDRSFGQDIEIVTNLCIAVDEALKTANIQSIIKHIPGHGRAMKDSHLDLPTIDTNLDILASTDFLVFKNLRHIKIAMTAHIIYTALDSKLPITLSKAAISYIREIIGFNGVIISDDLSMKALHGNLSYLTKTAIDAGCNIILHCNGKMDEMQQINASLSPISDYLATLIQEFNCFENPTI